MLGIGIPELLVILVIVLIIFGPGKLPKIGKSLGEGIKEFKQSITNRSDDEKPKEATIEKD